LTMRATESGKILTVRSAARRSERDVRYHLVRIVVGQRVPGWRFADKPSRWIPATPLWYAADDFGDGEH
jgi:hypothetical protein